MKKPLKTFTPKQENLKLLTPEQKKIFQNFAFIAKRKLYLAGGTALMFYLGHRTSIDFDFYTDKKFRKGFLPQIFIENLKDKHIVIERDLEDTFELVVNGVHLSCFYYPYKLLDKLSQLNGVLIASIKDIVAMKALAIVQRGTKRDFIDIYFLIKIFGLKKIISWLEKKYPGYQGLNFLKGLTYFEDAEKEVADRRIKLIKSAPDWGHIKREIVEEARRYQRENFLNY